MRLKLVQAGSPPMTRAYSRSYVRGIVTLLLQYRHQDFLIPVVRLLQKYTMHNQDGLSDALASLEAFVKDIISLDDTDELMRDLHVLYRQGKNDLEHQRGAIVELFAYELVRPRYKVGECLSNQRFLDERGRAITDQVDVAALSHEKRQIEGYECKLKVAGIDSSNCTNLVALAEATQERDYDSNVGIISLDNSRAMKRKLQRLQPAECIHLYGIDNLELLENFTFERPGPK